MEEEHGVRAANGTRQTNRGGRRECPAQQERRAAGDPRQLHSQHAVGRAAANAGHLAPYLNGEELSLESGLPLGVTTDAEYPEFAFVLTPGDTLTFLSDGVVEARNQRGELLGFERTQAISGKSAEEIVLAAQQFGQEDDITVLTLTFAPAAEVVGA